MIVLIMAGFILSLILAIFAFYRSYLVQRLEGEHSIILSRFGYLCSAHSKHLHKHGAAVACVTRYLKGDYQKEDQVFIAIELQEHLGNLPIELEQSIREIIGETQTLLANHSLLLPFPAATKHVIAQLITPLKTMYAENISFPNFVLLGSLLSR